MAALQSTDMYCMHAQGKRQAAKAEKMEKIRKGEKASTATHRTPELKQASKDFYKQARPPDPSLLACPGLLSVSALRLA